MSRSNPQTNAPNPAVRFFEWNGEHGTIRYYDKEKKENVTVGSEFQFLLLDQLGTVGGWHDESDSGIYANEVRDTRRDVLIVKAFKAGTLVEGVYRSIKDRVHALGGQFVANCYIGFKNGHGLEIGSIKFKGAALNAWVEFGKANRAALYKKALAIKGFEEGKKGRIVYRVPAFETRELSEDTNAQAVELDKQLQAFLADYLQRTTKEQVPEDAHEHYEPPTPSTAQPLTDDDIPF